MNLRPAEYCLSLSLSLYIYIYIYIYTPNTKQLRKAFHQSEESRKTAALKSASYKSRCRKLAIQIAELTDWLLEYGRYKLYEIIRQKGT